MELLYLYACFLLPLYSYFSICLSTHVFESLSGPVAGLTGPSTGACLISLPRRRLHSAQWPFGSGTLTPDFLSRDHVIATGNKYSIPLHCSVKRLHRRNKLNLKGRLVWKGDLCALSVTRAVLQANCGDVVIEWPLTTGQRPLLATISSQRFQSYGNPINVTFRGSEPRTSLLPVECSTDWARMPSIYRVFCWMSLFFA